MSRQIGDIFEQITFRLENGEMVECTGEFEVVSIDTQAQDDGSTVTTENAKLIRYLD